MSGSRCPNCDLLNLAGARNCLKCGTPLDAEATHSFKPGETRTDAARPTGGHAGRRETPGGPNRATTPWESRDVIAAAQPLGATGRRTFFWYRLLCSATAVVGIVIAILGIFAIIGSFDETGEDASDAFNGGIILITSGVFPALLSFLGVVFPPRPWSWAFGLALLILMTFSCALCVFSVPILTFWLKYETRAYFGRN